MSRETPTGWLRASAPAWRSIGSWNTPTRPLMTTIEGRGQPMVERGTNPEGGMMELTPAELSYVRSQGLHLTCRLPGFVTILAAINDKARHHSEQDPTC